MPDPQGGVVSTLTRDAKQLQTGYNWTVFGPGESLPPMVAGSPIRQWDFPPGVNRAITPRHTEPFNFASLRAFSNVELVRLAIETRKDQLEALDWQIKPRDNVKQNEDSRIAEITKFLTKPDGVTPFSSFMRALDEDLLGIDAPTLECRRTRGGKLIGLELVDGATINLLVDETGRRPRDPDAIAFQQIVRGVVWVDLKNSDLIYLPRNVRSNHLYGFGPVEQIIVTVNTILRRQSSQLAYFTEGNIPAGLIQAPEGWSNEQIRDLQGWFDQKLSGNLGEQRKLIWGPHGSIYTAFKGAPIKDDFDEWLARIISFAFSLPPTPFVRQMNRGTANADQQRALEEGLEPLKLWRKRWIDDLIEREWGAPDLEFSFLQDQQIDPTVQATIDNINLRNGSTVIDEVRDNRGEDPLPDGLGAQPMVYLTSDVIPLKDVQALIDRQMAPPAAPIAPGEAQANASEPAAPKPGEPAPAEKLEKAARQVPAAALALSVDRPKAIRARHALAKALAPVLAKAGIDIAAQVERAIEKAEQDPKIQAASIAASLDLNALLGLEDPLAAEIEAIGLDAASLALASIGVDASSDLVNQVNAAAVAYAKDRAAALVSLDGPESLIASTREMIRGIIAGGLEQNIGRGAIADQIQAAAAFSEYRAGLIADTEIAMANGAAKGEAWGAVAADGATMVKEWFVSGEEGVCDECELNESQGEISFDEPFDSGDDMEPAHPGCRCTTTARVLQPGEQADDGAA